MLINKPLPALSNSLSNPQSKGSAEEPDRMRQYCVLLFVYFFYSFELFLFLFLNLLGTGSRQECVECLVIFRFCI